ncbi:MAG: hypothetical protein ACYDER_03750 [Ktedonobacteraceae bacterium]
MSQNSNGKSMDKGNKRRPTRMTIPSGGLKIFPYPQSVSTTSSLSPYANIFDNTAIQTVTTQHSLSIIEIENLQKLQFVDPKELQIIELQLLESPKAQFSEFQLPLMKTIAIKDLNNPYVQSNVIEIAMFQCIKELADAHLITKVAWLNNLCCLYALLGRFNDAVTLLQAVPLLIKEREALVNVNTVIATVRNKATDKQKKCTEIAGEIAIHATDMLMNNLETSSNVIASITSIITALTTTNGNATHIPQHRLPIPKLDEVAKHRKDLHNALHINPFDISQLKTVVDEFIKFMDRKSLEVHHVQNIVQNNLNILQSR